MKLNKPLKFALNNALVTFIKKKFQNILLPSYLGILTIFLISKRTKIINNASTKNHSYNANSTSELNCFEKIILMFILKLYFNENLTLPCFLNLGKTCSQLLY